MGLANLRVAAYKQCSARYYNSKVNNQMFRIGDLVLRRVMINTQEPNVGALSLNWEGPYQVIGMLRPGTYQLVNLNGKLLGHP